MREVELPNPKELEEIKEKGFPKRVALITAIFAVILAVSSLGGNKAMKEMLLAQQQASNQWAYYQAKVIREQLYRSQKMLLEASLIERAGSMKPEARERIEAMVKKMADEEARYNQEKKEVEQEARKLEKERDLHRSKDPFFEFAEVLLQIAIVMASVSILATAPRIFYFSIGAAILGALFALNGFFLIVQIPFFH
jgi:ABC-type multidrug transport system fused ATPase/permease subunit